MNELATLTQVLRNKTPDHGFLDVGKGVEKILGVSAPQLRAALATLRDEGYHVHRVPVTQTGGAVTILKLLGSPDTTWMEARQAVGKNYVQKVKS